MDYENGENEVEEHQEEEEEDVSTEDSDGDYLLDSRNDVDVNLVAFRRFHSALQRSSPLTAQDFVSGCLEIEWKTVSGVKRCIPLFQQLCQNSPSLALVAIGKRCAINGGGLRTPVQKVTPLGAALLMRWPLVLIETLVEASDLGGICVVSSTRCLSPLQLLLSDDPGLCKTWTGWPEFTEVVHLLLKNGANPQQAFTPLELGQLMPEERAMSDSEREHEQWKSHPDYEEEEEEEEEDQERERSTDFDSIDLVKYRNLQHTRAEGRCPTLLLLLAIISCNTGSLEGAALLHEKKKSLLPLFKEELKDEVLLKLFHVAEIKEQPSVGTKRSHADEENDPSEEPSTKKGRTETP